MLALVVDEDPNARRILRVLLHQAGYKACREARRSSEALKMIEEEQGRIRLIVLNCDRVKGEEVSLVRLLAINPSLHLTPVVMISRQLSLHKFKKLSREHPRFDGFLKKPFGLKDLREGIQHASYNRATRRDEILLVGNPGTDLTARLERAIVSSKNRLFKKVVHASSAATLADRVGDPQHRIGCILISPDHDQLKSWTWLSRFKKTPFGMSTPIVYLEHRDPGIREIRMHADLFIRPLENRALSHQISALERRILQSNDALAFFNEAKAAFKQGLPVEALLKCRRTLKLDPSRWEAELLSGDILKSLKRPAEAREYYRHAMFQNPCSPHPYLKIMDLLSPDETSECRSQARQYCPRHNEIQKLVPGEYA